MNLLGQPAVARYLEQGLKSERLSPSLLFVGPSGVGKKAAAIELCRNLMCETQSGCGECNACLRVTQENHPDILFVNFELQAAVLREKSESQSTIKIETVRYVDNFLQLRSMEGHNRIAIFENAEKMTTESANALLKTLEEPPQQARILLLTNDERNLPTTIMSRCAVLRFSLIPAAMIANWLNTVHGIPAEQALDAAERAGGRFSTALELSQQEETNEMDLSSMALDEFFETLSESAWRKEGRKRALQVINHLIALNEKKLRNGDLSKSTSLRALLDARYKIDRYVSPRLVLENLYIKLHA